MRRLIRPLLDLARARLPDRGVAVAIISSRSSRGSSRWLPLRAAQGRLAGDRSNSLPPAATLIVFVVPLVAAVSAQVARALAAGAQALARGGLAVLVFAKLVGLGVTAFVFERDAAEAAAARLVPLALRARADVAAPGRTTSSIRSRRRIRRLLRMFAPQASRHARCGCSGASAAACMRRQRRQRRSCACPSSDARCSSVRREQPQSP